MSMERTIVKKLTFGDDDAEAVNFDSAADFAITAALFACTQLMGAALYNGITPASLRESVVRLAEQAIADFEAETHGSDH